jgi:hypothetical protein
MTESTESSPRPPDGWWSSHVDPKLASALKVCGVGLEPIDPAALRLSAVPVSTHFSKMRTNVLVHQTDGQVRIYVDVDLDHSGPNHKVRAALHGPGERNWRPLAINLAAGNAGSAVRAALETLGSPVMSVLRADTVDMIPHTERDGTITPNSILTDETRHIKADELLEAFRTSLHKPLARRIAIETTRRPPRACVVWAASGTGKGHLVRASAHILLRSDSINQVRHLSGAGLTCRHMPPSERDRAWADLLDEHARYSRLLLLVDHLDLGISGTTGSLTVLADAIDRGARILATIQAEDFLKHIQDFPFLARRLLPVRVPTPAPRDTVRVLKQLVRDSGCDVSAAALMTAVEITERQDVAQPAAAIDSLSSALAEARWRARKVITPDDITSVLKPDWPK